MYLGSPRYDYALNCHLVYLAIPGTRPLCRKKQNVLFYLYATAKSEFKICSNKHETGLVLMIDAMTQMKKAYGMSTHNLLYL